MKRLTLDDIFAEDDELGLLPDSASSMQHGQSTRRTGLDLLEQVSRFYEDHDRLPDAQAEDHDEMCLAAAWYRAAPAPSPAMKEADRLGLLARSTRPSSSLPDWRNDQAFMNAPQSLEDIFSDDDDLEMDTSIFSLRHSSPAAERAVPEHQANITPCANFQDYAALFEAVQQEISSGIRKAKRVRKNQILEPAEGDFFIRNGLIAYVAEKYEKTYRHGDREHRLRIVFSNGTESDPLMSSFRKSLTEDKTARFISRIGLGPLAGSETVTNATGTIYVARSLSEVPAIRNLRRRLHKIGVTSGDVRRRVADARNDPTFLMAPVEIVATHTLVNLSYRKVEDCLHRFFAPSRAILHVRDRMGKLIYPKEWFLLPVELVSQAADLIQKGTLHLYEYAPHQQTISRKNTSQ
ncbi:GIY-YIG nuclease family protein [Bombella sp. TMW 2.2559]|uniref:GIY-YIG nuclease family protein n=1 Tax=Bombella dulcis TaxID=2967339 RepID=A0ABT3WCY0_9PROT|nr:GIY-YIG nuclease family protein [Bombella dulcis]MCX5616945.1 GIY-YIG nuclease family protein [Bombella dulcis]